MIPQDDTATYLRPDFARVEPAPRFLHTALSLGLSR